MALKQLKITTSITRRDESSLQSYFDEIAKIPQIFPEDEVKLALVARTGATERERESARNQLVNANLRFVVSVAKQYQNSGVGLLDLIQEGNIGLIKASTAFDETKGFKFISYAVWWIRQSIMQYLSESSKNIRLPMNKVSQMQAVYKAKAKFFAEYGEECPIDKIAEITGIDESLVEKVLKDAQCQNISSIDAPLSDDSDSTFETVYNAGGDSTDKTLIDDSISEEIRRVLDCIDEREKFILCHEFGIGGANILSRTEMAETLNLTPERVRQLRSNALRKMKAKYGDKLSQLFS